MKMQIVNYFFFINLVLEDAFGHKQEHTFIRGRGKSDREGEVGVEGEESGGRGGGKWGKGGVKWGMFTPCPPPHDKHKT